MTREQRTRAVSRRTMITTGVAGSAALLTGLGSDTTAASGPGHVENFANRNNVSLERVHSVARNREVDLVLMYPEGVDRARLPICLMLHGRWGDARHAAAGVPDWLSNSVRAGTIPPYAILAVDGGGNNYWHHRDGDDPMWMLLDEVPRWLAERNLGGTDGLPFATIGMSMGGFGSLVYARRRNELGSPLRTTSVISPALLTNWSDMRKRRAFADKSEWVEIDPLHHVDALDGISLGVWCGTRDRFVTGTRRFIELADPAFASITPGGHNSRYYRKALPEAVRFTGGHVQSPRRLRE